MARPGVGYPQDPGVLQLLEEIIYHSVQAGNTEEAVRIYEHRLGGRRHLAQNLGEYTRGARILNYFHACPFPDDLGWYLRGLGELEASFEAFKNKRWAGALLCMQGKLQSLLASDFGWPQTRFIAEFLSGATEGRVIREDFGWGEPYLDAELHLLRADLEGARRCMQRSPIYKELESKDMRVESEVTNSSSWADSSYSPPELSKARLVLSELERRCGDFTSARTLLEHALPWITRSASAEHLCLAHLQRARLLQDIHDTRGAKVALTEGIELAQRCGFSLYHIDLQNLKAAAICEDLEVLADRVTSAQRKKLASSAFQALRTALYGISKHTGKPGPHEVSEEADLQVLGARHAQCCYIWGEIEAYRQLARLTAILGMTARYNRAMKRLRKLLTLVNVSE